VAAAATGQSRSTSLWQWVRHHLTSVAATIVDYSLMVACVEGLGLRPVPATLVGAMAGAVTSFTAGRLFIYHATEAGVAGQTWRYALVSAASLALNAGGEHLFSDILGLQYLVARVITSVIVSNAWNYPLQRFFVFSQRVGETKHPTRPPP
jgi:putative flippase GtrA